LLDIVITSNSPGEVSTWVKPAVKELKQTYPDSIIHIFLPPCVFASGSEKKVLLNMAEIDRVYDKNEYLKYILLRKSPLGFSPGAKGIVIFLGGDLFHAVLLGKRLDYPVLAYSEGVYNRSKSISKFMVPDFRTEKKLLNKNIAKDKVQVTGNLMLDAIEPSLSKKEVKELFNIEDNFIITLFPGSRLAEVEYMLPFFLESILLLYNKYEKKNHYKILLSRSPFVDEKQLSNIFYDYLQSNKLNGDYIKRDRYDILRVYRNTDKDGGSKEITLEILVFTSLQYTLMQITDLALTIPGTNNLELAYFGTPMLVLLPLNKPEAIPLEGAIGLIGQIPILGTALKRFLVPKMAKQIKYVSLINIIADEEIVPEVKGVLQPIDLFNKMDYFLENKHKLKDMKQSLEKAAGSKGAVKQLVKIVDEVLASYH